MRRKYMFTGWRTIKKDNGYRLIKWSPYSSRDDDYRAITNENFEYIYGWEMREHTYIHYAKLDKVDWNWKTLCSIPFDVNCEDIPYMMNKIFVELI